LNFTIGQPLNLLDCPDANWVLKTLVAGTGYTLSPEQAAEAVDVLLTLQQHQKFTHLEVVNRLAKIPVLKHFAAEVRRVFLPKFN
jgi:hypothetical protein